MAARPQEAIAIVGTACRFPGNATSPSELWNLVRNPRQVAQPIPPDRFSVDGFYHKSGQYHGHANVKEAYFLEGEGVHRRFDASFFGMNPAEAMCLDPQCRLLLEVVYESLEAAGLTIEGLSGSDTAVYTGQMVSDYDQILTRDSDHSLGTYHASGTSRAILSNRISYFFDWHGPSMTIDTACSSSLVALHHAVQQLRTGLSRVAVATGANLLMDPGCFISLSSLNMLSPDGRSRMWDADANGYARGEGIAAVVLKTLSAALEDGDHIECIIRETGFAQDGKTQGITSPNAAAQMQLIRDCYARAGLDLTDPAGRPQYFECHGTGTLAGDSAEAEAICTSFFPNAEEAENDSDRLIVGSIKSVVGHTEGTAGLAGILRASLALQNATIPPNLLFNSLNPSIKPFYGNLQVATTAIPWPSVPHDGPRRASVNSFGFGGANVHSILESYNVQADSTRPAHGDLPETVFTPFVFSASSESSLIAYLAQFRDYLRANEANIDLRDLSYTLHSRRTYFQVTMAIAASTVDDLCAKINTKLQTADKKDPNSQPVVTRASRHKTSQSEKPLVLGVFTGQGAQHSGMGSQLLSTSAVARRTVERLEARLSQLPTADRPSWSLIEELQKDDSSSRIGEATISQPLCTAVQLLQVDLLRAAGVEFTAVVGHSSGEIAAAYAAGFLSAEDAICIAYYRGLHSKLSSGPDGSPGAMMAVGTSAEDAQELCDEPEFVGRVCVAAINSPVGVTLAGDKDAIEEMKVVFEDEKKFARLLKVDKAYHSHHMLPCSEAYLKSLAALDVQSHQGGRSTWFSSVFGGEDMSGKHELLKGTYWNSNLVSPVLFQQAVKSACDATGQFDLAIEVGPHPALKGPVLQTIQDVSSQELPYTGVFHRGVSAVESVADGLGYIWTRLGKDAVHLHKYDKFVSGNSPCRLVKGLPTYAWDHQNEHWNESRYAKAIRMRPGPVHELLGHMTPDSNEQDMRWRHVLRPSEMPWLMGHLLQDQIVFPGAGYVVTALEAAMALCRRKHMSASLIELIDMEFGRALVFDLDESTVEVIVSLADIVRLGPDRIEAKFKYHAADGKGDGSLNLVASGHVHISLGEPSTGLLPARLPRPPNLAKVDADEFYSASRDLEYQWGGPFVAMDRLERKLGNATGFLNIVEPSELLIHPALLDAALQGVLLAYSYPGDGQLWTIHVPEKIRRVSVNPYLCTTQISKGDPLPFDSSHHPDAESMVGNIDVYPSDSNLDHAMVQVEGLTSVPLSRAIAQDDKEAFATVVWDVAHPEIEILPSSDNELTPEQRELAQHLERMSGFYLRALERDVPMDHPSRTEGPYTHLLRFASQAVAFAQAGQVSLWRPEWEDDTYEEVHSACEPFAHTVEMELLAEAGKSLTDLAKTSEPSSVLEDNKLAHFYSNAPGPSFYHRILAQLVRQLTHRNPHMDILEIGAGTGAATKAILDETSSTFSSYTFTATSPGLLELTDAWAEPHLHKMAFKTLDISQDPVAQGFLDQSYDVVVASLSLHATPVLEQTLRNARRLLKPGGQLVVLELLPTKSAVYGLLFGALPDWWLGVDEGRLLSPALNLMEWDALLRKTGFSGCDTTTLEPQEQSYATHFVVFASQATDEKVDFLRNPLSSASFDLFSRGTLMEDLVILGGKSLETTRLVQQIKSLVGRHCGTIRTARSLLDLSRPDMISSNTTVLSLADLDGLVLQRLSHVQWETLKQMLMTVRSLLWVSRGRRADNPLANMMVGMMRSVAREVPTLSYQILDVEDVRKAEPYTLAEALLRFQAESLWRRQDDTYTTVEPELVLDKRGTTMIPRLVVSKELNDRYNSLRRPVVAGFQPQVQNVAVVPSGTTTSGYGLVHEPMLGFEKGLGRAQMVVTHSVLSAVRVAEFGCMFVLLGKNKDSGAGAQNLVGLSTKHSSIASAFDNLSVGVQIRPGSEARLLTLVAHSLLAVVTLRGLFAGDVVLVHEPDPGFAAVLVHEAGRIGVRVTFITANTTETVRRDSNWLTIHPSAPGRTLSRLLPAGISVFVDYAAPTESESMGDRIRPLLPAHCRQENLETLFSTTAWAPPSSHLCEVHDRLKDAVARAASAINETEEYSIPIPPTILPDSISKLDSKPAPYSVIDWTGCAHVPALIRPVNSQITFSDQKTYWLAGLSGGLGLALCEWMVRRGAKFFVISSRRPNIDPLWLEGMRESGVVVKIASCDVTVREKVVALHAEICKTMPAIVGVAQGAMVLEDTAIQDMTLDNFLNGTSPKVEGSIHLNDLFQENTLDFFVFFSSVISIIGRPGQANYSAANSFMASLAEQRRQRGLAASIIHIGPVYGVGYAVQQDKFIFTKAKLRSSALIPTSERDFYQLFAEAVIAGRPGSSWSTAELFNGVRRVNRHEDDHPTWEGDALMSHFIRNPEGLSTVTADSHSKVPLKTQLAQARDQSQVYDIIQDAFLPKLYSLFQLDPSKMARGALVATRLDEMGIDSLVAVEIRGWFMKTLEVNIPVLKILSGIPIADLITLAAETIPERLVPGLELDSRAEEAAEVGDPDSSSSPETGDSETDSGQTGDHSGSTNPSSAASDLDAADEPPVKPETTRSAIQKTLKLSLSQEPFWFIWEFLTDKTSLNHTAWARITGKLRIPDFQSAIRALGQQHEVFRTCIVEQDGKPMQAVMETSALHLELGQVKHEDDVQEAVRLLQNHHIYDVARGQTVRVMLLSRSPEEHFFVAGLHPLIADGMSFQSLLKGVQYLYGRNPNDSQVYNVRQFSDYSERQHSDLAAGKFDGELQFWRTEYATLPPPLPILTLSKATSRPPLTAYENERAVVRVSLETKEQIQAVCRRYRATPFHFYLATFRVLLLRYSPSGDGEDVAIGFGDANRTEDEMMDVMGPFVNLLPLRLRTQASTQFTDLLQSTRNKAYASLAHSKVPFQVLLKELDVSRSSSYTSLFQCFVNYRQGLRQTTRWGPANSLALHSVEIGISKMPYDITLEMVDYADGECLQTLVVRKDLYGPTEATLLAKSYERLLKAFVANPALCLDQPDLFEPTEVQEVMKFSRGPSRPSQWPETVIHKIDQVAQTQPQGVAVRSGNTSASYAEILTHANAIAAALQAAHVAPGTPVAVLQKPTPGWVSSILGIMRLGAAYLPLDMGLPWARLAAMVNDCQPSVVLVDESSEQHVGKLDRSEIHVINISGLKRQDGSTPVLATRDGSAAILYTSGSSGIPKGIELKHEGLRNWAEPLSQLYGLGSEVVLQQTSSTFDLSLVQIFTALCHGGSLCLISLQHRGDAQAISNIMASQGVTFTCATPSEYAAWLAYGKQGLYNSVAWRTAFCAGEQVPVSLTEQLASLAKTDLAFYNLYGPTEASLAATGMRVPLDISCGPIAAGRPLPNYSVYVVDEQLRSLPVGVQGEVYIGGAGVAKGYLNKPELTAARFISNTFSTAEDEAKGWTTMHRTGDLGRWREDGTLLIEGRISGDTQVKLRGLRIDLAEIEHAIMNVSGGTLSEAVVSVHGNPTSSDKPGFLVAHVVFGRDEGSMEHHIGTIQSRLSNKLPQYMCPALIIPLDRIPTTNSGKVDRKAVAALPFPSENGGPVDDGDHAALTDTEMRLRSIWAQILTLNHRKVTAETDFFHVGGSSLLLLNLQARIREVFTINMPLIRMFESSTLGAMAHRIEHGMQHEVAAEAIDWDKETALSPTLLNLASQPSPPLPKEAPTKPSVVILTGATGQLGQALLASLVADPHIKHIHCIGVRNAQHRQTQPPFPNPKITLHEGDLVLPRLGLSAPTAAAIFTSADAIIHNAADMSYLKTYASLRAANLQSTKELVNLTAAAALSKKPTIPFHYISTVSVGNIPALHHAEAAEEYVFRPGSVRAYPPPSLSLASSVDIAKTAHGYVASKWASEVFLERVCEKLPGWDVVIHRPSLIMRPQTLGEGGGAEQGGGGLEFVENLRRFAGLLRAVPVVGMNMVGELGDGGKGVRVSGSFDVVSLEEVVRGVMEAVVGTGRADAEVSSLRFLHHIGSVELPLGDLKSWVADEGQDRDDIQEMEALEWARRAGELGMHPTMVAMVQELAAAETGRLVLPRLGR